jgi:ERCC4-related helicase
MSEDDEEVSKYIPGIRVGWVRVKLPAEYEMIRNEIKMSAKYLSLEIPFISYTMAL